MEQIEVTIRFGVGNSRTTTVPRGTTVGQLINNRDNKQCLGYPDNVKALISRVPQDLNTQLSNNDVVDLETVGTSKAA